MNALSPLAAIAITVFSVAPRAQTNLEPYRVQASASDTSFFEINSIRDSTNGSSRSFCGFQTPAGSDNLFEFGWCYRLAGDPSNSAFNDDLSSGQVLLTPPTYDFGPPVVNLNVGTMIVEWSNVDGRGFDATWSVSVEQRANDEARAIHTFTVASPGPPSLSIELFLFLDVDVDGAFADADLRNAFGGRFVVVDTNTGSFLDIDAQPAPTRYEVDGFGNGLDSRVFDPQLPYDLSDTGIPFAPGDFVGAMQWSMMVPAFGRERVEVTLGRNVCPNPGGILGAATNYGTSLGGALGAPRLASSTPRVGVPYEILIGNGPSNGTVTMLLGSSSIMGAICGVTLLVDPFTTLEVPLDIIGTGALNLRTPCDPAINGLSIFSQVFAVDFTSPSMCFPLVHSDGLQSMFGD